MRTLSSTFLVSIPGNFNTAHQKSVLLTHDTSSTFGVAGVTVRPWRASLTFAAVFEPRSVVGDAIDVPKYAGYGIVRLPQAWRTALSSCSTLIGRSRMSVPSSRAMVTAARKAV